MRFYKEIVVDSIFEVGDSVICNNNSGHEEFISEKKEYIIEKVFLAENGVGIKLEGVENPPYFHGYLESRFELVTTIRINMTPREFGMISAFKLSDHSNLFQELIDRNSLKG